MATTKEYDIQGIRGAEIFRALPPGVQLALSDGAVAEIVANAGDGAWVITTILEDPNNPDRVGTEEAVFFGDVLSATGPSEEDD